MQLLTLIFGSETRQESVHRGSWAVMPNAFKQGEGCRRLRRRSQDRRPPSGDDRLRHDDGVRFVLGTQSEELWFEYRNRRHIIEKVL